MYVLERSANLLWYKVYRIQYTHFGGCLGILIDY